MSKSTSVFLKHERRIAADEQDGILHRWRYGRDLLKIRGDRRKLPDGLIASLIKEAAAARIKISEREIQYRVKCAEIYRSESQLRTAVRDYGSWGALRDAGFPEILFDIEDVEPEDLEAPAHDGWEQLSLLPGFRSTFKLNRREIAVAEATVPDVIAYRDMCQEKHENYGKTVDAIVRTVDAILDGWNGDPETKAVDAYQRGAGAA